MGQRANRLPILSKPSPAPLLDATEASNAAVRKAKLISRLLSHYWTATEDIALRQAQADDWLQDLEEFALRDVEAACIEWRRSETRKPTIAEIRALAAASGRERQPAAPVADWWDGELIALWGPRPDGPRRRAEAILAAREAAP